MRYKLLFVFLASFNLFAQGENPFLFQLDRDYNINRPRLKGTMIHSDEHFSVYSEYNSTAGSYRRFIDPGSAVNAIMGFRGYKLIDDEQSFRGEFKVFKQIRRNWNWIFVRDYDTFNPNLIGDSTTGTTRYNGIEMSADYKYQFNSTGMINASLSYLVDEALKQLTPRPVSEHRDIKFEMSGSYGVLSDLTLSGGVLVGDLNESIGYREDQGGITQETILMKFTGVDIPSVVRKKTETRFQYINIYGGSAGLDWRVNEQFTVGMNYKGSLIKSIQKDDALDPRMAGYFRSLNDELKLKIFYSVNDENSFSFEAEYLAATDWSRAPERNVLYTEVKESAAGARVSHELKFTSELKINYGLKFSQYAINYDDHFSAAFLYKKKNSYFADAAVTYIHSEDLSFGGSFYAGTDTPVGGYITDPAQSTQYYIYRSSDLHYLYADLNYFGFSAETKIRISRGNYIQPRIGGSIIDPKGGKYSSAANTFFINISYLSDL